MSFDWVNLTALLAAITSVVVYAGLSTALSAFLALAKKSTPSVTDLAAMFAVQDTVLLQMLKDPENATINVEEIKKKDPTNMAKALLRALKMQELLEESLQAAITQLATLEPGSPAAVSCSHDISALEKQVKDQLTKITNTEKALEKVFAAASAIANTSRVSARKEKAKKLMTWITLVHNAMTEDEEFPEDLSTITDDFSAREIPKVPSGDEKFPAPPSVHDPVKRTAMKVEPPFLYAGEMNLWRQWTTEMRLYMETNALNITNKGEILNIYLNRTKPDTVARGFVQALLDAIEQDGTEENEDWKKLTHVLQTADWIHRMLETHFDDGTGMADAWHQLQECKQKALFKGSFRAFFLRFEMLRLRLGYPKDVAREIILNAVHPRLLHEMFTTKNLNFSNISYDQIAKFGGPLEQQILAFQKSHSAFENETKAYKENKAKSRSGTSSARSVTSVPANSARAADVQIQNQTKVETPTGTTSTERVRLTGEEAELVKAKGVCFNCFARGHSAARCNNPSRRFTENTAIRLRGLPDRQIIALNPPAAAAATIVDTSTPAPETRQTLKVVKEFVPASRRPGAKQVKFNWKDRAPASEDGWESC